MTIRPPRPLITFLGAARTVTGSKFLVDTPRARVLVDCGLFQGRKKLRQRNWAEFPVDPASIDAVAISHAHLDHVGYLPALVRNGYTGSIWASESTGRLAGVVMADSGRIQVEDARRANKKGYSKHTPALPLYTERDAMAAAAQFRVAPWHDSTPIADGISLRLTRAGHILGSASILLEFDDGTAPLHISGDLGRPFHPVLDPPDPPPAAGTVVMETTYGDTEQLEEDGTAELGAVIARTAERGGAVVIPAFSIDRTEVILIALRNLTEAGTIPKIPVFLDSPMARSALGFYLRAVAESHHEIRDDIAGHPEVFDPGNLTVTESVDDSKAINRVEAPLHRDLGFGHGHRWPGAPPSQARATQSGVDGHPRRLPGGRHPRQPACSTARTEIKIHGEFWPVRAEIASVPAFSVHADRSELIDWLASAPSPPHQVIGVHGDPEAMDSFKEAVSERLSQTVLTPGQGESILL